MPAIVDQTACTGCTACVGACPSEVISMNADDKAVVADGCVDCGACVDACPSAAISMQ
jgi:NAD-dependent dihydropyrimidine dehydrogenase PreA subunit